MIKKKTLLCTTMSLLAFICLAIGLLTVKTARAQEFVYSGTLNATYNIGEQIDIPIATVGEVTADFIVIYPDGNATSKQSFVAEQSGTYTVDYYAKVNSETLKSTKHFSVNGTMFSFDGKGSVSYVEPRSDRAGIAATIGKDSSLVYNDVIDLSELAWNKPFIKLAALPKIPGEAETDTLRITLIDVYDDNVFVSINIKRYMAGGSYQYSVSYIDASFNGGTTMGLYENKAGTGKYNVYLTQYENNPEKYPLNYSAYINNVSYGYTCGFSMTGGTAENPQNALHYRSFAYDYNRNQVLTTFYPNGVQYDAEPVADFSFREAFGGEAFKGFTDGKVKLKITPINMQKDSCTVFISEVAGKQITEMEAFSYKTKTKPIINVDLMDYSENDIPNAVVGQAYHIFEATGLDMTKGKIDVSTKVYYGYSNVHKARINIVNNTFTPKREGVYTIEYVATSLLGVSTTKLVQVKAVNKTDELLLILTNERNYAQNVKLGENIKLFDDYTILNNIGRATLEVSATLKSDSNIVYKVSEQTEYSFQPYYEGEYEIVYRYGDFIEKKARTVSLTVEKDDFVYYESVGQLPNILIKNGTYDVNIIKAYSCASGKPIEVSVEIYVQNDNSGTQTLIEGTYQVSAETQVKFIYKPVVPFNAVSKEIARPVVDVGMTTDVLQMEKYFVTTKGSMSFTATADGVNSKIISTEGNKVNFDFINPLQKQSFEMTLKPLVAENKEYVSFSALNIYLKDFNNEEHYVKLSLYNTGDRWEFSVNDGASAILATTWGNTIDELIIVYYPKGDSVSVNGGQVKLNLQKFYGTDIAARFTKAINLSFEIECADDNSGIIIQNINGQKLSSNKRELGKPVVDFTENFIDGDIKYGEIITTLPIMCYDVLSPTVNATLKIIAPSGGVVEDINGNRLTGVNPLKSYQFKLNEYGTYTFVIYASDINKIENSMTKQIAIEVVNAVLPEITIFNITNTASVDKAFKLAEFSVDNKPKDGYKSYYVICTPESVRELVKDGKLYTPNGKVTETGTNYTPKIKGSYNITVMVIDNDGNMGETTYTVEVK